MNVGREEIFKPNDQQLEKRIREQYFRDTVNRLVYFSLFLAVLFFIFSFHSYELIKNFRPNLSLIDNIWPRVLFNTLPFLLSILFLKSERFSSVARVYGWLVSFCVIFLAACFIHVWPIALYEDPNILLYVNATNTSLFAAVAMMLSLPIRDSVYAVIIMGTLVWGPLFFVAFQSGNSMIGKTIVNDTLFLSMSAFIFGTSIYKFRYMVAALEIKHEIQASKFLGPAVSKAIFNDSESIFQEKRIRGFIINLDIRDSTELQKKHGLKWLAFRKEYFAIVSKVVSKHKGYVQKTAGDGHIINFGVMDDVVDLSGIPNIDTEEARAEHARLERASNLAMACLDELYGEFFSVVVKHFGDESVRLGGGIDKGWVERSVQGDRQTSMELDVNGDSVNCSARLQEYSKAVRGQFDSESSLLVLSPFASDYIPADKLILYKRIETIKNPIRNYSQIRWVLVREFKKSATFAKKKAA